MSSALLIAITGGGVTGCGVGDDGSRSASDARVDPRAPTPGQAQAAESPADSSLRTRADSVIAALVTGINGRDAALVAGLAAHHGEPPDSAAAREAIDDFRQYFRDEPISRHVFVRHRGRPPGDAHFEYDLIAAGGVRKRVVAYYDAQADRFRAYDEFLTYSVRARALVRGVVDAMRRRDAARLARLLSPDDIDYPVSLAERAIATYARRFDLGTLRYRFDGLAPERRGGDATHVPRWFRYTLHGTKAGASVEHRVEISHGDGLVGWRDPLVPRPSQ